MYSARQIQCMEAIGLVPWVRRDAAESVAEVVVEAAPVDVTPTASVSVDVAQGDRLVMCAGNSDAALLLIIDGLDAAAGGVLSQADDLLLSGMLQAIGESKKTACYAIVQPQGSQGQSLNELCQAPRKRFLYFGGSSIAADATDPVPMKQGEGMDGWQLPSLQQLRAEPQRKRHAWTTLKKLRAALDLH